MFDAKKTKENLVNWVREWFSKNGENCKAVIGISGGKDSTVAAAICAEALGKENVIGVLMPNGEQSDIEDSFTVCQVLGIKHIDVNIGKAVASILNEMEYPKSGNFMFLTPSAQTKTNLPPRIRMAMLYAISQTVNGRVINTSNMSESYVGYSTRWGDSVGDVSLFGYMTSEEVVAVGNVYADELLSESFRRLVNKTPSDGLCGRSDEDNLGFTYADLNKYILTGECEDDEVKSKINHLHDRNEFKRKPIPTFNNVNRMLLSSK